MMAQKQSHRIGNDFPDRAAKEALSLHESCNPVNMDIINDKVRIIKNTLELAAAVLPMWSRHNIKLAQKSWQENCQMPRSYENDGPLIEDAEEE